MKQPTVLREADHYRNVWHIDLDPGATLADTLDPKFWAHVAGRLKAKARIEVHAADGSWFAELMVRSATRTEARVVLMREVDLDKADKEAAAAKAVEVLEYVYRGPVAKHSVRRKSDGAILAERLESKREALGWIANPPPAQAAAA